MVRLEYFERRDFPKLIEWIADEETMMNWAGALFTFPLTESSLDWYISDVNEPTSEAYIYRVVEEESGEVIGHISLGSVSRKNRSARISRVFLHPTVRGKGYCYLIVRKIIDIGFNQLGLHRISLGVYSFNKSAIRCYQKSGFTIEGTMRENLWFKDTWWSLVEMSILEQEFRAND